MTWLKYQWTEEEILAYLLKQYTGQEVQAQEPEVTVLREPFRRKTQRLKGKRPFRKVRKKKLPFDLYNYRYNERQFRRQFNKELTTYPWSDYVMT